MRKLHAVCADISSGSMDEHNLFCLHMSMLEKHLVCRDGNNRDGGRFDERSASPPAHPNSLLRQPSLQ
jgi:hypothetical protein